MSLRLSYATTSHPRAGWADRISGSAGRAASRPCWGIDFYRKVVHLNKECSHKGERVRNALQTNGTLLDPEWAAFLKENGFLVGLSIDGPRDQHDRYRIDRREMPTFDRVMAALKLLRDGGVDLV